MHILSYKSVFLFLAIAYLFNSVPAQALSCASTESRIEQADAIFSVIPMKGELRPANNTAVFDVVVYRVWRGAVDSRETIVVSLPRMLSLGDEFVLASSRNDDGFFLVSDCTLVALPYRDMDWVETLDEPVQQYSPSILEP